MTPQNAAVLALVVAGLTASVPTGVATATLLMWLLPNNMLHMEKADQYGSYQKDCTCY